VLTLTLTGIAADSPLAGGGNPGLARRTLSVVLMFAGAAAGAWLLRYSVALPPRSPASSPDSVRLRRESVERALRTCRSSATP